MGLCPFIKHMGQFRSESAEIYPSIYIWGSKSFITCELPKKSTLNE